MAAAPGLLETEAGAKFCEEVVRSMDQLIAYCQVEDAKLEAMRAKLAKVEAHLADSDSHS